MHCCRARNSQKAGMNMRGADGPSSSLSILGAKTRPIGGVILSGYSANTSLVRLSPMAGGSRVKPLSLTGEDA